MTPAHSAHGWNSPRQAIGYAWLNYQQQYQRAERFSALSNAQQKIAQQPECLKREIFRYADFLEKQRSAAHAGAFYRHCAGKIIPRIDIVNNRWRISDLTSSTTRAVFRGHFDTPFLRFLASRLVNMVARYNRMPDMNKADIDRLADDIAHFIRAELAELDTQSTSELNTLLRWYRHAALICQQFNVEPPHWKRVTAQAIDEKNLAPAVTKMFNARWWRRQLQRTAALWREHLYIALGSVSRRLHPYASPNCLKAWKEQKRRTREFLKGMELEDEEGHRISLIDQYDASPANPAIRRCELMVRLRGFENICVELGFVGEFCTLTAPSKFHATLASGRGNPRWEGDNPQDTQGWFNRTWACIRARLHREAIRVFGIRVAEPHHDGTPHWHMLLFMQPTDRERVTTIIREYALKEDAACLNERAQAARFQTQSIDPQKGSATGYIAKYIAKNIDGYALDGETDHESGRSLKDQAASVCAWASRWRIRQFQFIGGAPVTVYRELRRLGDSKTAHQISVQFAAAHDAADSGDWQGYINAQGGPFTPRETLAVRPLYVATARFNDYGEEIISLRGVYDTQKGINAPVITRTRQWKIVPRRVQDVQEVSVSPWSSVTNCTPSCPVPANWTVGDPLNRPQRRRLTRWLRYSGGERHKKTRSGP
jgi:hypothetical protein